MVTFHINFWHYDEETYEIIENGTTAMAKENRMVKGVAAWSKRASTTGTGWMVLSGSGAPRKRSSERAAHSGLRLVEAPIRMSKYEPISANAGMTPRWIQAVWLCSVLVYAWALYVVSLGG